MTAGEGPTRAAAFLVFAQRSDSQADVEGWNAHASRFFRTRIGRAEDHRDVAVEPVPGRSPGESRVEAVRVVITPEGQPPAIRSLFGRPRDAEDLALAEAADARAGGTGLALLARRCPAVWLVEREADPDAPALLLAAILAGSMLGPILDVRSADLFGVKTARERLAGTRTQPRS